jgi:hypothetical protein
MGNYYIYYNVYLVLKIFFAKSGHGVIGFEGVM